MAATTPTSVTRALTEDASALALLKERWTKLRESETEKSKLVEVREILLLLFVLKDHVVASVVPLAQTVPPFGSIRIFKPAEPSTTLYVCNRLISNVGPT